MGLAHSGKHVIFITYGPPGSGKSGIVHRSLEDIYGAENGKAAANSLNFVPIIVDDMVQALPGYEEEKTKCENQVQSDNLYYGVRGPYANGGLGVGDLSDKIYNLAVNNGRNVIFETTGRSIDEAWFNESFGDKMRSGYLVQVMYPWVDLWSLIERVQKRQRDTGQQGAGA